MIVQITPLVGLALLLAIAALGVVLYNLPGREARDPNLVEWRRLMTIVPIRLNELTLLAQYREGEARNAVLGESLAISNEVILIIDEAGCPLIHKVGGMRRVEERLERAIAKELAAP